MEEGQKEPIGGIKFSEEQVQVTLARTSPDDSSIHQLLHLIAQRNINVSFLCHSVTSNPPESIICVERSEFDNIQQILSSTSFQSKHINITPAVGILTLFPHRNSFKLLGLVFNLFGKYDFPIHSLSTSISAIAIITDYSMLEMITERLQDVLSLPENHAPFRQSFLVTQIQQ